MLNSLWEDITSIDNNKNELDKDLKVDTLIIGGGICGVLCAYYLKKNGVQSILVEKNTLGSGITKNTTAVFSAQQEILYRDRVKKIGFENAKKYLEANLHALELIKELSEEFSFDYEEISSFIYNKAYDNLLYEEYQLLQTMGYDASYLTECELPFHIAEVLEYKNQAQINPLKLINELSKKIDYYTNTEIIKIKNNIAYTNNHNVIQFKRVVVCTHFPPFKIKGLFSLKMNQEKSYVIAIKTDKILKDSYVGLKDNDMYFRCYRDQMIIGSNDSVTGCLSKGFSSIENYIKKHYSNYQITNKWINQDCITLDDVPYIGRYTRNKNYYVATGFNMWGMTSSILAANIISDLIDGTENEYKYLFSPKRKMYKKKLFSNLSTTIKSLIKPSERRCTHLGSSLKYISEDKSYECPCHGSKFDKNGKLITNPAKNDLK